MTTGQRRVRARVLDRDGVHAGRRGAGRRPVRPAWFPTATTRPSATAGRARGSLLRSRRRSADRAGRWSTAPVRSSWSVPSPRPIHHRVGTDAADRDRRAPPAPGCRGARSTRWSARTSKRAVTIHSGRRSSHGPRAAGPASPAPRCLPCRAGRAGRRRWRRTARTRCRVGPSTELRRQRVDGVDRRRAGSGAAPVTMSVQEWAGPLGSGRASSARSPPTRRARSPRHRAARAGCPRPGPVAVEASLGVGAGRIDGFQIDRLEIDRFQIVVIHRAELRPRACRSHRAPTVRRRSRHRRDDGRRCSPLTAIPSAT